MRDQVMEIGARGLPAGVPEPARRDPAVPPPVARRHGGHRRRSSCSGCEKLLADRKISLELDDKARAWLAQAGYDPVYGARPLKRVIQRELQNPLAEMILKAAITDGDTVKVSATGETSSPFRRPKAKAKAPSRRQSRARHTMKYPRPRTHRHLRLRDLPRHDDLRRPRLLADDRQRRSAQRDVAGRARARGRRQFRRYRRCLCRGPFRNGFLARRSRI